MILKTLPSVSFYIDWLIFFIKIKRIWEKWIKYEHYNNLIRDALVNEFNKNKSIYLKHPEKRKHKLYNGMDEVLYF